MIRIVLKQRRKSNSSTRLIKICKKNQLLSKLPETFVKQEVAFFITLSKSSKIPVRNFILPDNLTLFSSNLVLLHNMLSINKAYNRNNKLRHFDVSTDWIGIFTFCNVELLAVRQTLESYH